MLEPVAPAAAAAKGPAPAAASNGANSRRPASAGGAGGAGARGVIGAERPLNATNVSPPTPKLIGQAKTLLTNVDTFISLPIVTGKTSNAAVLSKTALTGAITQLRDLVAEAERGVPVNSSVIKGLIGNINKYRGDLADAVGSQGGGARKHRTTKKHRRERFANRRKTRSPH
jgi:hypothetical protein